MNTDQEKQTLLPRIERMEADKRGSKKCRKSIWQTAILLCLALHSGLLIASWRLPAAK